MKNICKKTIVISIILLLIGVSVSSATTNVVIKNLIDDNQPPSAPVITHPFLLFGKVGEPIPFSFNAVDPDGDNVSYYIEWGDGTSYGWTEYYTSGQPITIAHTWNEIDWYNIVRCKAKDIYDKESDWSYQPIPIKKNTDCGCKEGSDRDLIRVERLLDRVEVYSKLLLILSRFNPELKEVSEELSYLISTFKKSDWNDNICDFLWGIIADLSKPILFLSQKLLEYEEDTIMYKIVELALKSFLAVGMPFAILGIFLDCDWADITPPCIS